MKILVLGGTRFIRSDGEAAPYNGESEYSINTNKAELLGYTFSEVKSWIFDLLDDYINII